MRSKFQVEWSFFYNAGLRIKLDLASYEEEVGISIALGIFSLYVGFDNYHLGSWIQRVTRRKGQRYGNGRSIGLAVHGGYIWLDFWNDPMESRGTDPWWWHMSFNPMDAIFGRYVYSDQTIEERDIEVPMPEKAYPATAKLQVCHWQRKRSPFIKRMERVSIEIPGGIPKEGKGENSWDCGLDATFSMTTNASSIAEGVGQLVGSVLADRIRHGGWGDWNFKKTWPEPTLTQVLVS